MSFRISPISGVLLVVLLLILFGSRPETRFQFGNMSQPPETYSLTTANDRGFPFSDFSASISTITNQPMSTIASLNESVAIQMKKEFWEKLRPGFSCPLHLFRRSSKGRGGHLTDYALCGNHAQLPHCLVYSFGVQWDSGFEADLLTTTNCALYAYDPTVDLFGVPFDQHDTLTNPRLHFKKTGIGAVDMMLNGKIFRTLKTLMRDNGGHEWIDILKIDVEGAEVTALTKVLEDWSLSSEEGKEDDGLPFGQLAMELHPWECQWNRTQVVEFLQRLEASGLRLFDVKLVPAPKYDVGELAFINIRKLYKIPGFEKYYKNF